ncbi:MAG: heme exporter protein CcmD [Pseudomonadota bacterium]|nr:heme exporter protein CcmD [Pseudomonadota bacterium]
MPDLGPHASFIWLAYGAAVVVLAGLVAWLRADLRAQQALLTELESSLTRGRSAKPRSGRRKPTGKRTKDRKP